MKDREKPGIQNADLNQPRCYESGDIIVSKFSEIVDIVCLGAIELFLATFVQSRNCFVVGL